MDLDDLKNIIFEEYAKYKNSILEFQEQHRLIFGKHNADAENIMTHMNNFANLLCQRIKEEDEK
jgi:hypothetical protein